MPATRIVKPSIMIGATQFNCKSREVTLEPGDWINFCEQEWTCSIDIELAYGTGESWTVLQGFQDTTQTVVIKPADAATSATNPTATFTATIPAIAFVAGAVRGERMTYTLELTSNAAPVFTFV